MKSSADGLTELRNKQGQKEFSENQSRFIVSRGRLILTGLFGFGIILFAGYMLIGAVGRPLDDIIAATRRLAAGETSTRIDNPPENEIGRVAAAFNLMAHKLEEHVAEINENQARMEAVQNTAMLGIVTTIAPNGMIETINPAACGQFGYASQDLVGRNISMLMPNPYRDNHDNYMESYLRTGERKILGVGREVVGQRKNGETFPIKLLVSEVKQSGKHFFVGMVEDITARKQAEDALIKFSADIKSKVDVLLGAVSRVRDGDLTTQVGFDGEDSIGQLASALQHTIDKLAALLAKVQEAGILVTSSATEIAATGTGAGSHDVRAGRVLERDRRFHQGNFRDGTRTGKNHGRNHPYCRGDRASRGGGTKRPGAHGTYHGPAGRSFRLYCRKAGGDE